MIAFPSGRPLAVGKNHPNDSMKPADIFLAVLVAVIWGLAFVASRLALDELPPTLMTTLRFAIAAVACRFVLEPDACSSVVVAIRFTPFLRPVLADALVVPAGVPGGLPARIAHSPSPF